MPKICPPGFICIENMTVIFLIIILVLVFFVYCIFINPRNTNKKEVVVINSERNSLIPKTNSVFSTIPSNILMNPFAPPLKNSNYFPGNSGDPRGVPININTRGFNTNYSQMGILTRLNGDETILPIMGRALYSNHSKWQYYTMSDKSNSIKLPMSNNGRSCTSEYGCDELMSGDTVYVEGYKDAFKVTIYENSQPRYIPF
tara:strand:- start:133 stop:735 length:603 start_codon:yes stop_codon:yes gene_type:complete